MKAKWRTSVSLIELSNTSLIWGTYRDPSHHLFIDRQFPRCEPVQRQITAGLVTVTDPHGHIHPPKFSTEFAEYAKNPDKPGVLFARKSVGKAGCARAYKQSTRAEGTGEGKVRALLLSS